MVESIAYELHWETVFVAEMALGTLWLAVWRVFAVFEVFEIFAVFEVFEVFAVFAVFVLGSQSVGS